MQKGKQRYDDILKIELVSIVVFTAQYGTRDQSGFACNSVHFLKVVSSLG